MYDGLGGQSNGFAYTTYFLTCVCKGLLTQPSLRALAAVYLKGDEMIVSLHF